MPHAAPAGIISTPQVQRCLTLFRIIPVFGDDQGMKKLTDSQVKSATAPDKPIKLFDGDGLYLYVAVSGRKTWRLKYKTRAGKWDEIAIGKYTRLSHWQKHGRSKTAC
ncbi:Arm DNA-binding domain-containing protein [Escherichia coli]